MTSVGMLPQTRWFGQNYFSDGIRHWLILVTVRFAQTDGMTNICQVQHELILITKVSLFGKHQQKDILISFAHGVHTLGEIPEGTMTSKSAMTIKILHQDDTSPQSSECQMDSLP